MSKAKRPKTDPGPETPARHTRQSELPPAVRPVTLQLPLGALDADAYRGRGLQDKHCEARLDRPQADTLRRVFNGLDATGARLRNGKRIASNADVVRWILERVAEGEADRAD